MSPTGATAANLIELREYQKDSIEAVRDAIRAGKRRIVLVIPTGGGKTYTAVSMIASAVGKGKRCLFVAHRIELIDQTVKSCTKVGLTCVGVILAGDPRRDASQPIQVASIQTLARRKQDDVGLIVIDEGHRAVSPSYRKALLERHPKAIVIIITATPARGDGKPLGCIADALIIGATYSELMTMDPPAIVEPVIYSTPLQPDLSKVRTDGGDYNREDLEKAMNKGALIGDLFVQWNKHPRQRTVCFAVSVAHSKAIVELFRSHGVRAEHLDGETPKDERRAILARLTSGETELVSNVGVLTEGWDCPPVKTCILARPTKSIVLFMQTAGRVLRPWNDVRPLILDHGGNIDRHGFPTEDREWSLDARLKRKGGGAPPVKTCPSCFAYVAAAAAVCPHCGIPFETGIAPNPAAQDPVPLDLELRTLAVALDDPFGHFRFFRSLVTKARSMGWHYGTCCHRFRELRHTEPEQAWVDALKKDYGKDKEWKAHVKTKSAERERRKREEEEAERAATTIDLETVEYPKFDAAEEKAYFEKVAV